MKVFHSRLAAGLAALGLLGASATFAQQPVPAPSIGDAPAPRVAMAGPSCSDANSCTDTTSCCDEVEDGSCGSDDCACYLFGPSDPWALTDPEKNCRGIKIGGWLQAGYYNKPSQFFNYNVPDPGVLNLNQAWLYAEKATDGSDGLDFGYRADILYGTNGAATQAFGNPGGSWDYANGWDHGKFAWAMPQLYGEVAYDKLKVKAGHFYTPMGYEVVGAPGNFFFSHSWTNFNSEPFTHTGALATYTASDKLTIYGGWVLGWDTGFDQLNQGQAGMSGFTAQVTEKTSFTYIGMYGNLGQRSFPGSNQWSYNHSIVMVTNITDKLSWVVNSDLVASDGFTSGLAPGDPTVSGAFANDQYSLVNYLFYKFSDCWGVGARAEWWKTDGTSLNEVTFGVNYRPHANFVLRPEIRHEWSPGGLSLDPATLGGGTVDTTIFAIDGVLTF